jgi:gamma-glutamyltranspeptidase
MSPTIAIRNSNNLVRIIGGASGGPRIITGTAQVNERFV